MAAQERKASAVEPMADFNTLVKMFDKKKAKPKENVYNGDSGNDHNGNTKDDPTSVNQVSKRVKQIYKQLYSSLLQLYYIY